MPTVASATALPTFTPALKPPQDIVSHPERPASLLHLADIAVGICVPLVTLFFLTRLYVRVILKRVWILEDYVVSIGSFGTLAYCGILRSTMLNHGGQHGWDITPDQAHQAAY